MGGDYLVSSPTAVLLPNDGKGLHHRGRLLRDPPALQYLLDLWIPSTAQLMSGTLGPPIRRTGAAESTTAAGSHSHLPHRPIRTIAPMVSQIGKQVGQWARRSGAAESTARVVRTK